MALALDFGRQRLSTAVKSPDELAAVAAARRIFVVCCVLIQPGERAKTPPVAMRCHKHVAGLHIDDLTGTEVLAFLQHIEKERKATVRSRNCRLAAIRSFFLFVADREPLLAEQCAGVLRVPFKKAPKRALCYLESTEVSALFAQPNRESMEGQRDHALLSLLRRRPRQPDETVFVNRYGEPLSASGFRFRLRSYVKAAAKKVSTLARKQVTPQVFRHTTAVHLIFRGSGRDGDPELVGSRQPRYDQSLRTGEH